MSTECWLSLRCDNFNKISCVGHASIPQNSFVNDRRQEMYIYRKRGCSLNVGDIVYSVVVRFFLLLISVNLLIFKFCLRSLKFLCINVCKQKQCVLWSQQPIQFNLSILFLTFLLKIEGCIVSLFACLAFFVPWFRNVNHRLCYLMNSDVYLFILHT